MAELPTGTVTFFFSDIEGSTRLLQDLGEGYRELLERHGEIIRGALIENGGVEVSTEGDSFFATFTTAPSAVACAAAVQKGLASEAWPAPHHVRVRIGLHTGEGRVGGSNYAGLDVHRAARIMGCAHGGQTVLSAATANLAERSLIPGTTLRDLGEHELKDLVYPEHLYQLNVEGLQEDFPPLRTVSVARTNLPRRDTAFIGRVAETETVVAAARDQRLVTLVGAAGVGKTSLAMHAADGLVEEFPDGVWFVEIARVQDPNLVAAAVAKQLRITETVAQPIAVTLSARLEHASIVLVLDGCEHLVAAVAGFAENLLRSTTGVHLLATSREPLAIRGELLVRVLPLAVPSKDIVDVDQLGSFDAVALFADRARQVHPSFQLRPDTAPVVAEICRRLDGIPLAIELAAARLKMLSVRQLAERLNKEFAVLTSGRRDALPHHQTLRATLDWSYDLLGPVEQMLFARLSVFSGGFSLEAAEDVCSGEPLDPGDVLDVLGRLVDTSLALATATDPVRYRLLEPIAQYARLRLDEQQRTGNVRARHAAFFLKFAEDADAELLGPNQVAAAVRLDEDRYNLLAALSWMHESGDDVGALRLAGAIQWFWVIRREVTEGAEWLEKVLAHRADAPAEAVVRALNGAGLLAQRRVDFAHARAAFLEGLDVARRSGDDAGIARQTYYLAVNTWFEDDPEEADRLAAAAQALADPETDPWTAAWTLALRGTIARSRGDHQLAEGFLAASHALFLRLGALDQGWSHLRMGALERDKGNRAASAGHYQAGRVLLADIHDEIGLAHAEAGLGAIAWLDGDRERALTLFKSALDGFAKSEEATDSLFELKTMVQGNPSMAELEQVARWNKERAAMAGHDGTRAALAEYLYHMGKTAQGSGELIRARAALIESLSLSREAGDFRGMAVAAIRLGRIDADAGHHQRAAVLYGGARAIAEADHVAPWPPFDEPDFEDAVAAIRSELGGDAFDRAVARGQAMTVVELIDAVMRTPDEHLA